MPTKEIPDEVREKIKEYADCRSMKSSVISDVIYGYSLALSELEAARKEIELLRELLKKEIIELFDGELAESAERFWNAYKTQNNI